MASLAAVALTAAAHAQLGDVGEETGLDTPHTPVAKAPPPDLFTQVAGARWRQGVEQPSSEDLVADSPTPLEVTFRAVAARDIDTAFAGGATEQGGEQVPVIYRYTDLEGWEEEEGFPAPGRGYVAAIAWIDERRALAVGGDGAYPERERDDGSAACDPQEEVPANEAGMARAWLYAEGEGWRELEQREDGEEGDELPDQMSALTALDFYLPAPGQPVGFGIAGGLCQLWHWHDGSFARDEEGQWAGPDRQARHRVRDVSFAKLDAEQLEADQRRPRGYAVTSGCCLDLEAEPVDSQLGAPETLTYTVPAGQQPHKGAWTRSTRSSEPRLTTPDSHLSVTATHTGFGTFGAQAGQPIFKGPGMVTSPGGPAAENEPPSQVGGRSVGMSSVRLTDGDGDTGGTAHRSSSNALGNNLGPSLSEAWENPLLSFEVPPAATTGASSPPYSFGVGGRAAAGPDGVPDWSVGELRSNGRGAAYGTDAAQLPPPEQPIDHLRIATCPGMGDGIPITSPVPPECRLATTLEPAAKVADGEAVARPDQVEPALQSSRLLALPSYGLNAIDVLDADGAGWAVGEHGAIVQLTVDLERARAARAQDPPQLGQRTPGRPPDRSPWDAMRPDSTGEPGIVPALSSRPRTQEAEPKLHLEPGPIPSVSSRDGSQAVMLEQQGQREVPIAYRDGETWYRCGSAKGDAHPFCASFEELSSKGVRLVRYTRVPVENDDDPTNDDELQLVATTDGAEHPIVRYRDGRWEPESDEALGALAGQSLHRPGHSLSTSWFIAFTAPDDGLLLLSPTQTSPAEQYVFDGSEWRDCSQACDPGGRLRRKDSDSTSWAHGLRLVTAGDRIYAYGSRGLRGTDAVTGRETGRGASYPLVIYRDRASRSWSAEVQPGEYDPGWGAPPPQVGERDTETGLVSELVVLRRPDGRYEGWALGTFNQPRTHTGVAGVDSQLEADSPYKLLRLHPDGSAEPRKADGAPLEHGAALSSLVTLPPHPSRPTSFMTGSGSGLQREGGYLYALNPLRNRWEVVPSGRFEAQPGHGSTDGAAEGGAGRLIPDGAEDFWLQLGSHAYRYTDRPLEPVFSEVPPPAQPVGQRTPQIKRMAATPDGTLWAATDSEVLYRYDRAVGWDRVRIPGWDPGRVVTMPSPANAVALGPNGRGLVVGRRGRIARIEDDAVELDPAAGTNCEASPAPPCGTPHDLGAVAVAPDGAAIAGGAGRALLWRPAGGELRAIEPPPVSRQSTFSVAIASEDRVWAVANGRVFAGQLTGGGWSWRLENEDADGKLQAIEQVALDREGRGFGIGGARIYRREGEGERPWRAMHNPSGQALSAVALPAGGGEGALIGGAHSLLLTLVDGEFEVARPADFPAPYENPVLGLALTPGVKAGQVEAWASTYEGGTAETIDSLIRGGEAATTRVGTGRLFHHSSDPGEPLLDPDRGAGALPDAPAERPGEVSFAAFGKTDCHHAEGIACTEYAGLRQYEEVVLRRIVEEIAARARSGGAPQFALSTGDAVDEAGIPGNQATETAGAGDVNEQAHGRGSFPLVGARGPRKLRRWGEAVADALTDRGVPLFGAIGVQDLSGLTECVFSGGIVLTSLSCTDHKRGGVRQGENLAWRQTMALRSAPWAEPGSLERGGLRFERVADGDLALRHEDAEAEVPHPLGGPPLRRGTVAAGGADTHYAIDVHDEAAERRIARLVFADTSLGSLAAGDPIQQPLELEGGQAAWLERVLCFAPGRTANGEQCTRDPDQPAIVVSNAPTYSYGPAATTETQGDAAAFEAILMRHHASMVVSGRLGWNGRYWARAPGLHEPCPGASYPERPPRGAVGACDREAPEEGSPEAALEALGEAGDELGAGGTDPSGLLPFVVASGAGGKFFGNAGPTQLAASDGFWHGYTIVRLDPSGDPRGAVVEQRPVYDYVGIEAQERVIRPGRRVTLRGFGRGPIGYRKRVLNSVQPLVRFDQIDSAAVTHRYDLLLADPEKPWVPLQASEASEAQLAAAASYPDPLAAQSDGQAGNPCEPYVCLDPDIATVDPQSGEVKAGRGNYPRTFAIAKLSVGEHVATYPLLFEPRPSFRVPAQAQLTVPPATPPATTPPAPAPPTPAPPPPPPAAQPPSTPPVPGVSFPAAPTIPSLPPLGSAPPAPAPPPPAPPAPPAPPPGDQGPALELFATPQGISIAPQTTAFPPPPPPVNPAPPGGARREARQRQAATQKSGADSDAEHQAQDGAGDLAESPRSAQGAQMTRRSPRDATSAFARGERTRPVPSVSIPGAEGSRRAERERGSFTPLARAEQPSAWARSALYGGGITLMSLVLALGFTTLRPGSRRRRPEVPAPALSAVERRRG